MLEEAAASPSTKAATTPMISVTPNAPRKNQSPVRAGRSLRTSASTVNVSVVGDSIAANAVSPSSTSTRRRRSLAHPPERPQGSRSVRPATRAQAVASGLDPHAGAPIGTTMTRRLGLGLTGISGPRNQSSKLRITAAITSQRRSTMTMRTSAGAATIANRASMGARPPPDSVLGRRLEHGGTDVAGDEQGSQHQRRHQIVGIVLDHRNRTQDRALSGCPRLLAAAPRDAKHPSTQRLRSAKTHVRRRSWRRGSRCWR